MIFSEISFPTPLEIQEAETATVYSVLYESFNRSPSKIGEIKTFDRPVVKVHSEILILDEPDLSQIQHPPDSDVFTVYKLSVIFFQEKYIPVEQEQISGRHFSSEWTFVPTKDVTEDRILRNLDADKNLGIALFPKRCWVPFGPQDSISK